ncbi:Dynamin central region [Geosmithia morbida]|uniref:Dynamin central region n=1 Tax=Geosmithia morbida TaxID=1094350 RepID=A0A9P4YT43_9HYPO|nr:Dynamin central region [Geosmithia morbida]KAF4121327.1 Dynamin central region [Geosmithia morbida]
MTDLPGLFSAQSGGQSTEGSEIVRAAVDRHGHRTVGLITEPDDLYRDYGLEAFFLDLAKNKNTVFGRGWHVLRNRSPDERGRTTAQRDEAERDFFSKSPWNSLRRGQVGVETPEPRSTDLPREQITVQLPSFADEAVSGISDAKSTLQRLGSPRDTI